MPPRILRGFTLFALWTPVAFLKLFRLDLLESALRFILTPEEFCKPCEGCDCVYESIDDWVDYCKVHC